MAMLNPFLYRGVGLVDLLLPIPSLRRQSLAMRLLLEVIVILFCGTFAYWGTMRFSAVSSNQAIEIGCVVSLYLLAVRPIFSFCYYASHRQPSAGKAWGPIIGLVVGSASVSLFLAPAVLLSKFNPAFSLTRLSAQLGGTTVVLLVGAIIGIAGWVFAHIAIPNVNSTNDVRHNHA